MSDVAYQLFNDDEASNLLIEPKKDSYSVQNLDRFLVKVYNYFLGKGYFNIVLSRFLNLISLGWVILLSTFLLSCVDYKLLFETYSLEHSVYFRGMHPMFAICFIIFSLFFLFKFAQFFLEIKEFWEIKQFYNKELQIKEDEIETVEWREIVKKLVKIPRLCIFKEEMTPLDIANRIMRKDNYLIAIINKDILNLKFPGFKKRNFVTKTIEWGISYTIFTYLFDYNNIINKDVLDATKSAELARGLRFRFRMMGLLGLIASPFIFIFLLVYFVFQYGEQLHNKPNTFAMRQWSPLARWKFRELNELPHVFQKRLKASFLLAEHYVSSFPMFTLTILARFVSFVIGSLVGVLLLFSIWDEDSLFTLELTPGRSAVWFVGIGGTVVAACRSLIPDEHTILDPEQAMEELVQFTHYLPKKWRGRTHTSKVLKEFMQLFDYRFLIFTQEVLSVLFAPFILIFSLPQSSDRVIEFFRTFTVNEPGVGYICKFASFPLGELGNAKYGADSSSIKRNRTKQGKMEKSFLNFKANHPEWRPPPDGLKYLENVTKTIRGSSYYGTDPNNNLGSQSRYGVYSDPPMASVFEPGSTGSRFSVQDSVASLNKIHRMFFKTGSETRGKDVIYSDKEL